MAALAKNDDGSFVFSFNVLIPSNSLGVRVANAFRLNIGSTGSPVSLQPRNPVVDAAGNDLRPLSGFIEQLQDSLDPNYGDQSHHFAAFFELGYLVGSSGLGALTAIILEGENFFMNTGDINLGIIASKLGADLKGKTGGIKSLSDVVDRIRGLCAK